MADQDILVVIDFPGSAGSSDRLVFRSPREVVTVASHSDVIPAIDYLERIVGSGSYAAGFIAYEAASAFDPALKVKSSGDFPLLWFGVFDFPIAGELLPDLTVPLSNTWYSEIDRETYDRSISHIHAAIANGESYQTNFTFRLRSSQPGSGLSFYNHLFSAHPCPYSAFIDTGRHTIISNSPELFLAVNGRDAVAEPMKGTIPRGNYAEQDLDRAKILRHSEKDRAEHIMIVDLMRSDLGKVAEIGSVSVIEQFALRKLPTVWQMTSRVAARLKQDTRLSRLLGATFPPGSVTGAPKPKTMEIIDQEEKSPRKAYCGTIGMLKPDGTKIFNVPIRTIVIENLTGAAECGIGGGITSGSIASDEFAEALSKSRFLTAEIPEFQLLESLLMEGGEYFLLDLHLRRQSAAAGYFGFVYDETLVRKALLEHAKLWPESRRKVRVTSSAYGEIKVDSEIITEYSRVTVSLADRPINTDTPYVYHKTTKREMYNELKDVGTDVYDVLLWNESRLITEFTTANVVLKIGGVFYTPPVSSGLLAGTMRAFLLDQRTIIEQELTLDDLWAADEVWLINSVRKWLPVDLEWGRGIIS